MWPFDFGADCSNFISFLNTLTHNNLPFPQPIISFQACLYGSLYRNIFSSWQIPTHSSRLHSSVTSRQASLPSPLPYSTTHPVNDSLPYNASAHCLYLNCTANLLHYNYVVFICFIY